MAVITEIKGLKIVTPAPGAGGAAISDNFAEIADRTGPVTEKAFDPTTGDDSAGTAGNGKFFRRSSWINTVSGAAFILIDDTPTAADWQDITDKGALLNIVEDLTPQLGGNLDVTTFTIFTLSGDMLLDPFDCLDITIDTVGDAVRIINSVDITTFVLDGDSTGPSDGIGQIEFRDKGASRGSFKWGGSKGVHFDQGGINQDYTFDTATIPGIVIWKNNSIANSMFMDGNAANFGIFIERETEAGITASTTQTQGQGALVDDVNEVSTVANPSDTTTLPSARDGRTILVINNGANTLQLFPASGDNLGAGVNAATTIDASNLKIFTAYDTTNWKEVGTSALENIVEDLTPQLGGNLDINGNEIISLAANPVIIAPGGAIQMDSGGNARGTQAVDLQSSRTLVTQVASGARAFIAGGQNNVASGTYAHVEGSGNTASASYTHAEGANCIAAIGGLGNAYGGAHAEGFSNKAYGYSHAEGFNNTAGTSAYGSAHAEGYNNTASGFASHAEGGLNTASLGYAHAEGRSNMATAYDCHAEGYSTTASGANSHSEGRYTTASYQSAHAEGSNTTASKFAAHSEGDKTKADARAAHSEGYAATTNNITASGTGSHAGGRAIGTGTVTAIANGSFAHGNSEIGEATTASGIGAGQFGPGVNAEPDSWQVGGTTTGIRLNPAGAPAALHNGDMWVASGYAYIRSNGVSVKIT